MLYRTLLTRGNLMQALGAGKNNFFTSLWNKPQTRDERVKEYVPEVLEESLAEQREVLNESTSRDVIVDLGHKILKEIENKSPTPSISPHLNKLLQEYGAKSLIAQRPLSYLLYPSSSALSSGQVPHELVSGFADNFRSLIEEVERNGCSVRRQGDDGAANTVEDAAEPSPLEAKSGKVIVAPKDEHEPLDVTHLVRVVSGMAMANVQCSDLENAVQCVDTALAHVVDKQRLGGLLGMKAGILVHQKKYLEAADVAQLAVEASGNIQGYLHGAHALKMLKRPEAIVELLERGKEDHPMNLIISNQLEAAKKDVKLQLGE